MSLVIVTGSNTGESINYLKKAKIELSKFLDFKYESHIYSSPAVDYLNQPDFYNQALEFELPNIAPDIVMKKILNLEKDLGRVRTIDKGPRVIDIDIIFWGLEKYETEYVSIPHPEAFNRSFVILPISELPYSAILKSKFSFPSIFSNTAFKI